MTFDLPSIGVLIVLAIVYAVLPAKWRIWVLLGGSILAVYTLQPRLQIRWLDFLLPTLTLLITIATWYLTRAADQTSSRDDIFALVLTALLVTALAMMRYLPAEYRILVASRPPNLLVIVGLAAILLMISAMLSRLPFSRATLIGILLVLFIILKTEVLATGISAILRRGFAQDETQAKALDLGWLGFSYMAFRLIHTIRDRQSGILPVLTLREYITYIVFFPAFIAGPIDRAERFVADLRDIPTLKGFDSVRFTEGCTRIGIGIFKKFVIADSLAQGMALDATNAAQVENTIGLWLLLYGYALRLFFDFAGYSDIAIGIAILFGIKLPENFRHPYTRMSITEFWQSWHITLSDWVRTYVFSPFSRWMLKLKPRPSPVLSVLIAQLVTMITIGLWHGVTLNFVLWGIWHGVGLWVHKQIADRTRKWYRELPNRKWQYRLWSGLFWFITFHYVVLGWVWFALPNFDQSMQVFRQLFGGQ
jgi:alginate O-acetyltransferase complex protein AlgI